MLTKVAETQTALDYAAIGARIRLLRKQKKLRQIDLAEIIGVERSVISRLEHGELQPSNTLLDLLLCNWKINPNWLYRGEGEIFSQYTDVHLESLREKGKEIIKEIKECCQL